MSRLVPFHDIRVTNGLTDLERRDAKALADKSVQGFQYGQGVGVLIVVGSAYVASGHPLSILRLGDRANSDAQQAKQAAKEAEANGTAPAAKGKDKGKK